MQLGSVQTIPNMRQADCLRAGGSWTSTSPGGGPPIDSGLCFIQSAPVQQAAPKAAPAPPVYVTVSPQIQSQISPTISPVFQQQFQPSNSPQSASTQAAPVMAPAPVYTPPAPVYTPPPPAPPPPFYCGGGGGGPPPNTHPPARDARACLCRADWTGAPAKSRASGARVFSAAAHGTGIDSIPRRGRRDRAGLFDSVNGYKPNGY